MMSLFAALGLAAGLVAAGPAAADPFGPARHDGARPWAAPLVKHGPDHGARVSHRAVPVKRIQVADQRWDRRDKGHGGRDDRRYRRPVVSGGIIYVPPKRVRHYRNIRVIRPYGRWYFGYGHYAHDSDAWKWLAFTAITVAIIDNLNEHQQRVYEDAQIKAATAPVGETIHWADGSATGTTTAVREGTSTSGRYCREFQQTVTIGGRTEDAYGTACRQPDGSWEVVSSGQ
jgi:hypothetical protein